MSDATEENDDPLVGRVLADRYRIERLLGAGGMGAVYLGEHILMRKPVAVKVLHRELTFLDEIVARFEREAIAAARIDHPNVAAATDFGRLEDGSLFMVLEYVAGRSLSKLVEVGPLGLDRSLAIARQVAAALTAAHTAGIVHRDLKPENVMLIEQGDGRDLVKVLDFGIAKISSAGEERSSKALTRIGTVMGTASYMSPEQAVGQTVDARSDLYSFGVILYEMLSGDLPFRGDEITQILAKQITEKPPPLPEETPPDVVALVMQLLEKRPDDRVQTAQDLLERIDTLRSDLCAASPALSLPDPGAAPVSLRTGAEPVSVQGATMLDAAPLAPRRSRRGALVAFGFLGVSAAGALAAWAAQPRAEASHGTASPFPSTSIAEPAPASSALATKDIPSRVDGPGGLAQSVSSTRPSAEAPPAASEAPPPASEAPAAAPKAVKQTTTTKKTTSATTTKKTTTTTTKSTAPKKAPAKRRTGPGGIYIPPPSQWF